MWIPRELNKYADLLSRQSQSDCDDWQISLELFSVLNAKWGPFTVDRFASDYNAKCARFNSRSWVKGTEAVNSLTVDWAGELNWLVPPPKLIISVIKKMLHDKARGLLVVPVWKSAPFWPLLYSNKAFASFVSGVHFFSKEHNILPGKGFNGVFTENKYSFHMMACLLLF